MTIDKGKIDSSQARPLGFFIALLIFVFGLWRYFSEASHAGYWIGGGLGIALLTALYPRLWLPVLRVWMPLTHALGWLNTHLILGVVFFIMMVPLGWVLRLFRHDPLCLRTHRGDSGWIEREKELTPASFKEAF